MPFPENLLNSVAEASMEASKKNCPENNPVQDASFRSTMHGYITIQILAN